MMRAILFWRRFYRAHTGRLPRERAIAAARNLKGESSNAIHTQATRSPPHHRRRLRGAVRRPGAGAYAAVTVTGKQIKDGTVTGKDVKNRSLGAAS